MFPKVLFFLPTVEGRPAFAVSEFWHVLFLVLSGHPFPSPRGNYGAAHPLKSPLRPAVSFLRLAGYAELTRNAACDGFASICVSVLVFLCSNLTPGDLKRVLASSLVLGPPPPMEDLLLAASASVDLLPGFLQRVRLFEVARWGVLFHQPQLLPVKFPRHHRFAKIQFVVVLSRFCIVGSRVVLQRVKFTAARTCMLRANRFSTR